MVHFYSLCAAKLQCVITNLMTTRSSWFSQFQIIFLRGVNRGVHNCEPNCYVKAQRQVQVSCKRASGPKTANKTIWRNTLSRYKRVSRKRARSKNIFEDLCKTVCNVKEFAALSWAVQTSSNLQPYLINLYALHSYSVTVG